MITDETLAEYLFLQKQAKIILDQIEMIKDNLKELGPFCTENYAVAVYEQERTGIAGLKECINAIGLEILSEHELIRHSKFLVVKVAPILQKQSIDL